MSLIERERELAKRRIHILQCRLCGESFKSKSEMELQRWQTDHGMNTYHWDYAYDIEYEEEGIK